MGELLVRKLEVGMLGTNCYILMDEDSCEGFIIDPGAEARRILEAASAAGLECKAILCTHGHMDHVAAAGKVSEGAGAPVLISREDAHVLEGSPHGIGARLGSVLVSKPKSRKVDHLQGDQQIEFGPHSLRVVPTPGHTSGSMSFIAGDHIFCGDLVMQGSIGRTDLRGGSMTQLLDSVRKFVFTMPDETRIHPGHGPSTTVADEKKTNPFLRGLEEEA